MMMKRWRAIPLSRGLVGLVDRSDFERVNRYKWHALKRPRDGRFHVMRTDTSSGRKRTVYLHRWLTNATAGVEVDHRNNNGLDNRRENLRMATRSQNAKNFRRDSSRKASQYHGVSRSGSNGRWAVVICAGDPVARGAGFVAKQIYIGLFRDETEAALAYDSAARMYHGEFAITNFDVPNFEDA